MIRKVHVMNATLVVAIAFLSLALGAQTKPASGVAGRWTLEAPESPHGPQTLTLVLEQKGSAVSGTLNIPHAGDLKMTGRFEAGRLTMATDPDGDHGSVSLSATLKADTLTGHISSERGDVKWTAKRQ